jgi:hypothetical protein
VLPRLAVAALERGAPDCPIKFCFNFILAGFKSPTRQSTLATARTARTFFSAGFK